MEEYVTGRKASEILGVHQRTLYQWEKKKWIETIRTPGNKRLYNVKKYLKSKEINIDTININIKKNIIYGRVSSLGQKNDLERQINVLKNKYPTYELITDIGSGMNMNRKGLRKIIDFAINDNINELVIVHKDRLCRF